MLMMTYLRKALSSIEYNSSNNNNSNNNNYNYAAQDRLLLNQHYQQQQQHNHNQKNRHNNNNNHYKNNNYHQEDLTLDALNEQIRNLLNELYLRGPETVGIFRKSPNAKHCRELKQKLEINSQNSIEEFQVTVIASVFKEYLRSLPDCILMSRLYPQWIDVAKLIEPLHQHQQSLLKQQLEQERYNHSQSQSPDDTTSSSILYSSDDIISNGSSKISSLRPQQKSTLTDNCQFLDRAHSSSTMASEISINNNSSINNHDHYKNEIFSDDVFVSSNEMPSTSPTANTTPSTTSSSPINKLKLVDNNYSPTSFMSRDSSSQSSTNTTLSMSDFALSERHSECIRIIRQLLDTLNKSNLILLRSFICVLWHISKNSDYNMMSANNLGICVGPSLLSDEHPMSSGSSISSSGGNNNNYYNNILNGNKSTSSTFAKRHRRTKSQSLLSSKLSFTSSTSLHHTNGFSPNMNTNAFSSSNFNLNSYGAQETAKYVPILVAFMIENAPTIFGKDVISIFSSNDETRKQYLKRTSEEEMKQQAYENENEHVEQQKQMQQLLVQPEQEPIQLHNEQQHNQHQHQQHHHQHHDQPDCLGDDVEIKNVNPRMECQESKENFISNCNINLSRTGLIRDDGLTSILIINPTKRQQEQQQQLYLQCLQQQQHYLQCQQRQQQLYLQCQQHQKQQNDRLLLYQYQPYIKPQQSRVMSLRDYYLSKNQTIVTLV